MRRLAVAAALICSMPLFATDTTYELLSAPWIRGRLIFQVTQAGQMQARRDGDATYVDIADGAPFVISEQRDLTFHNFNPFKFALQTSESSEKDPNYTAIAQFLDAVKNTAGGVGASKHREDEETAAEQIRTALRDIQAPQPAAAAGPDCSRYEALQKALYNLHELLKKEVLTTTDFHDWVESATDAEHVAAVRKKVSAAIKTLQDNVQAMKEVDAAIGTTFVPKNTKDEPSCNSFKASTFALVYEITRTIDTKVQSRTTLIADLQTLNESLKKFADSTAWRDDAKTDYIFYKPSADFETIKTLNIAVKPRTFSLSDDGKLTVEEGTSVGRSIRLRAHSWIVPEVAGGLIQSDLEYPKYGTSQGPDGKTIVARAGSEKLPVQGAVVVNLVCRCWGPSIVYPAIQLGATNSKQYPGFLVGLGARFAGKYSFSLVGGRVISWFEDLDGLAPGDSISGTAELQSHLKRRRAPNAKYIGVQYNF